MFDENQLAEIKWRNNTKRYYESKGYVFTGYGSSFFVAAKDLSFGSAAKVEIVCDFCGEKTYPYFYNYNNRKNRTVDSCNNCKVKKQWFGSYEYRAKEKFDVLRRICEENDYELLTDESEYTNCYMDIEYICKKHGYQCQMLDNIVHGHRCFQCSYVTRADIKKHSQEYVKSVIESFNGNKWINENEYVNALVSNLVIRCGSCENTYVTSFDTYHSCGKIRCNHCSKSESNGEFKIRNFLEKNKIKFIQEKRFSDCKDVKTLPFDFYLSDFDICIEFNGVQHYKQIDYFGGHEGFEKRRRHDMIKYDYCKSNKINLICIPYWDEDRIEEIISNKLNIDL